MQCIHGIYIYMYIYNYLAMFWLLSCAVYAWSSTWSIYVCDIFGVNHIWLQSDAAFVYPRLD